MFTETDEGYGLVKTTWDNVRKRVAKVEPVLAKIIDSINPGKLPLYLAYYSYGQLVADAKSPFIPSNDGSYYRLSDPNIDRDIQKNLGYGKADLPLGLALNKNFELFIDLKEQNLTIPYFMYQPGSIFSFLSNLSKKRARTYSANSVYHLTAGARSTFMLPNIECATHHAYLQRDFNIKTPVAKSLYQHWDVFRDIANSPLSNCDWRACIIFFSEKWLQQLQNNKSWYALKIYLYEKAWEAFQHDLSQNHYAMAFSLFQLKNPLRFDPYLVDTVQHLLKTAMGSNPAYSPCLDDNALPINLLQKVFVESYKLTKYFTTIMTATYFTLDKKSLPVYYSLNYPSVYSFSKKSRKLSNTLHDLRSIYHIMSQYVQEFKNDDAMCGDSRLNTVVKNVEFSYFHNEKDLHKIIQPTKEIEQYDNRFSSITSVKSSQEITFASDARFVRGCIRLQKKK